MVLFLDHQPDDSQDVPMLLGNTNTTSFNDDLATGPFENRNIVVADVTVWPTHVLHAPQPQHPCLNTIHTAYSPVGNEAIGLSISRPPAPIFNHPQPHRALRYDSTTYSSLSHIDPSTEHHSTHPCRWDNKGTPCSHELQVISKNILAHFHRHHCIDVDPEGSFTCSWIMPHFGCCGKKLKVDSFSRHIITHIGIKLRCSVCSKRMAARNDLVAKHRRDHAACSQATFDTITDCHTSF
ncbi:hypothetical protein DFJ58DRAFT_382751 [Suillus subalutaceus]|uniref:uncharacterized protein n=1 Tax=Suillus subalutaceus TaxID=48586 RepID=UPI001B88689D|nr:uncharacterized protein DFJ58DRAFT_382751 [Suillus subalutaceus]KAG1854135.1 hypothetical protein DFJ58DRAFT_382751 [Suillus subalutaceus]